VEPKQRSYTASLILNKGSAERSIGNTAPDPLDRWDTRATRFRWRHVVEFTDPRLAGAGLNTGSGDMRQSLARHASFSGLMTINEPSARLASTRFNCPISGTSVS